MSSLLPPCRPTDSTCCLCRPKCISIMFCHLLKYAFLYVQKCIFAQLGLQAIECYIAWVWGRWVLFCYITKKLLCLVLLFPLGSWFDFVPCHMHRLRSRRNETFSCSRVPYHHLITLAAVDLCIQLERPKKSLPLKLLCCDPYCNGRRTFELSPHG